ncbi:MAG: MarR family transcriptional regulator [Chloroflexota bacterium]
MPQEINRADQAAHRFLQLFRYLRKHAREINSQGISPPQYAVLRYIAENDSATVGQIQEYLYKSPSTTSTLIAKLEAAGHVTRTRSKKDNRVVHVELTESGGMLVENTPLGGITLLREQLKTLPEERLTRIDEALSDLMTLMDVQED